MGKAIQVFPKPYSVNSKKYSLNKVDLKKIGVGGLIAIGGAGATYLTAVVGNTDFGSVDIVGVNVNLTPIIVALFSIVINIGKKFVSGK